MYVSFFKCKVLLICAFSVHIQFLYYFLSLLCVVSVFSFFYFNVVSIFFPQILVLFCGVVLLCLDPKNCVCSLFERFSVTDWTIKNISFTFCFPAFHKATLTHNDARILWYTNIPNCTHTTACAVATNTPNAVWVGSSVSFSLISNWMCPFASDRRWNGSNMRTCVDIFVCVQCTYVHVCSCRSVISTISVF